MIIFSELALIAFLSGWVYLQYLSDVYFQSYVNSLAPLLVPVLSIMFGICSASIATYLYISTRKIRTLHEPEMHQRKKMSQEKRSAKHTPAPLSNSTTADAPPQTPGKLRPLTPVHSNNRVHKQVPKEPTDSAPGEAPTTRKDSVHD